jgi:hypothetical protein
MQIFGLGNRDELPLQVGRIRRIEAESREELGLRFANWMGRR